MGSFHQSKRSGNKWCAVQVRWGIFIENLTYCFIPKSGRKYSHTNSYNSAMTVIVQDDHLTTGARAVCVLCIFFTLVKKIRSSVDHRCIFIYIYSFFNFVCIKGHPSSDSGPSKENFMKRVQIQDDEEAKCQRWWRARKQEIAWASCVRVVFISRIFIHTVRKGNFATQDWTEAGATKWRAFF